MKKYFKKRRADVFSMVGKASAILGGTVVLALLIVWCFRWAVFPGNSIWKVYAADEKKFYTVAYDSIFSNHGYKDEEGNIAYCANQNLAGPGKEGTKYHQISTKHSYDYLMYHGYPNTNTINGVKWLDNQARDITQYVAWLIELGHSYDREDQSEAWNKAADKLFKEAVDYKGGGVEDGASTLWETDDSEKQMIIQLNPKGSVKLKKVSSNQGISEGNSCYSLKDAIYGVYSDEDCTKKAGELRTDAEGESNTLDLSPGKYWVKEISAPKGFKINKSVKAVTVKAGQTAAVSVEDDPGNDPVAIQLEKLDKDTGKATAQGGASLAGAQFTIKYYDGYYTKDTLPKTAKRTWVIKTKKVTDDKSVKYRAGLDREYKVSGDDFYYSNTGSVVLPYGTISIEETKAPAGYLLKDSYLQPVNGGDKVKGIYVAQIISRDGGVHLAGGNVYTVSDEVIRGGVEVKKRDLETGKDNPQGKATLEGAKFNIININDNAVVVEGKSYATGKVVKTITTDKDGNAKTAADCLPHGDYKIVESSAPEGYLNKGKVERPFSISVDGEIVPLTDENKAILNQVIRGGVKVKKRDLETGADKPQGGATLEGAKFDIINANSNAVLVEGTSYGSGEVVKTITTDKDGNAETASDCLPYGDYKIVESSAPKGYLTKGAKERPFSIEIDGEIVSLTDKEQSISDQVIRGGVKVKKRDLETGADEPQGGATLEGAKFDIINANSNAVLVEGTSYGPGKVVKTIVTDKDGNVETASDCLPYGNYKIVESSAPNGYLNKGMIERPFSIDIDGEIVSLTDKDSSILNQIKRGGVKVQKRDLQSEDACPEGGSVLKGAKFDIISSNKNVVVVDGKAYETGKVVKTIVTDQDGNAETASDCLPYGDYKIVESSAPEGYLSKGIIERSFSVREEGVIVSLTDKENSIFNQVKRGDLEFVKIEGKSHKRMVNVPFRITSMTTDESHIAVTDDNGYFSTESAVNAHSSNTNANDGHTEDGKYDSSAGIWFGLNGTGENVEVDDELGALPYDNYLVEELRCETNKEHELVPVFKIRVYADKRVIRLGTITNEIPEIPEEPEEIEICTTAVSKADGSKIVKADDQVTIVDTVTAEGLEAGRKYRLTGWQMVKDENRELKVDGKRVENVVEFTADAEDKEIHVEFTFSASALGGRDLVTFEELYDITEPEEPELVAEHKDIEDEGQTVTVEEPEETRIYTNAESKDDGSKTVKADGSVTIVDTVTLEGLITGKKYQLKGWQMVKSENAELMIDGKRVENMVEFTADEEEQEVQVEFTFDASALGGKNLVTFEELYDITKPEEPKKAAEHKNLGDEGQTVLVEEQGIQIRTTAVNKEDGSKTIKAGNKAVIVDTVSLKGLKIGKKYRLSGWQMLKEWNTEFKIDGKRVENTVEFTADEEEKEMQVEFIFDATALGGLDLVTFEELYDITNPEGPKKAAEHKDLEDEGQTVFVTEQEMQIHTNAANKADGSKTIKADSQVTIVDTVSIKGLKVGREYKLLGWQMIKDENAELKVDGKRVESGLTFKADAEDKKVKIEFTFDASTLSGLDLVTFEELYDITEPEKPEKVAVHKDIEDEDQTVSVRKKAKKVKPKTTEPKKKPSAPKKRREIIKTGDTQNILLWVLLVVFASAVGAVAYWKREKSGTAEDAVDNKQSDQL